MCNLKIEEQVRKGAIRLYLEKVAPAEICKELDRSRQWFYKWLKRYETGETDWYKELSRAPEHNANKTLKKTEEQVLKARSVLEKSKYSHIGAFAIQWELEKLGIESPPIWTINRILKRHNVVQEKKHYQKSNKAYPDIKNIFSNSIQQADLVGPRYIKNDGRFYSLNVLDIESYFVSINPCRTKEDENIAMGLLHAWKTIGKPDFLQLDNELSFRGSNRHPRSLGLILRMCLALGVQVIFIPIGEPWRNGVIEKFQDVFDKMFFRKQFFTSFEHLKQEARIFEKFRNTKQPCSTLQGKTPTKYIETENISIVKLDRSISLRKIDLSLSDGYIHFVRFIRSDCAITIFGEKFKVHKSLKYEYVIATICTKIHHLQIRLDNQLVESFEYRMPFDYKRY